MILDRARARANRARAELKVWVSPVGNPFVGQFYRGAGRGKSLWRVPVVIAFLWALPMLLDWLAAPNAERDLANDGALYWIGIAFVVAFIGRLLRCEAMLRIEILKHRFEPLQLMPLDAARRAWLWSAPPTLFALLTCALTLPALAWGLGDGLLTFSDALGLIMLALMLSWGRPAWRPTMWRGQLEKSANAGNRSDGFIAPPAAPGQTGWGWLGVFLVGVGLAASGVGWQLPLAYWQGLPVYLRATGDEFWMTWPLFIARWLMGAQPFFGFALAPVVLVIPIWLAHVHNGVLRLGAVTASGPYWTEARRLNWRRAARLRGALWALLIFGLAWPGSVSPGSTLPGAGAWMGTWFVNIMATRESALAAWWIVALALACLGASCQWVRALGNDSGPPDLRAGARNGARNAARALMQVGALYGGAHLLGWAWPFGALWWHILPASLAVASVWLGAQGAVWSGLPGTFNLWHLLWFYAAPATLLALVMLKFNVDEVAPTFFLCSPWTLWITLRDPAIGADSSFQIAIALHAVAIALSAARVWRARDNVTNSPALTRDETTPAAPVTTAIENVYQPPVSPTDEDDDDEEDNEPTNAAAVTRRAPLDAPTERLARLLGWLARFDNPLLQLETRRVIGNDIYSLLGITLGLDGLAAFILVILLPFLGMWRGAFPFYFLTGALVLMLAVWWVAPLLGIGAAARAYDNDRLDGSLQALFLTPLTQREIAVGKLGPYLTRGALTLILLAPMWLMGLIFCPFAGEPMLTAAYAAMPFFAAGWALRLATASHYVALAKRRVGSGGTPAPLTLGALVILPTEAFFLLWGGALGAPLFFGAAVALSLAMALQSLLFWRLSLRALRRERERERGAPNAD